MRIGAASQHFLKVAGWGFDDFVLCIREELLYLLFLGRTKGGGNGHIGLVEIGPVLELVSILGQRQWHGRQ